MGVELVLLICWIVICSVGSFLVGRYLWSIQKKSTVYTCATIVRVIQVGYNKRAVFRYTILNGREIDKTSLIKDNSFKEGQTIGVKYNPKKPTQVVINGKHSHMVLGAFLMVVGIVFFVIFLYLFNYVLKYI